LEYVPLHERQHMRFMHAGSSPNFLRSVKQHLNPELGWTVDRAWGTVNWPARSLTIILWIFGCGDT